MKDARFQTAASREEAFRVMFEAHYARVVRYAESVLADAAAAEDVASEVFKIAWQKFDPQDPFGLPWLIRTAMNRSHDVVRSRYRRSAAVAVLSHTREDDAESALGDLERLAVHEAMQKLAPKDRQVLELTYWTQLSAGEIAQVLKMREAAVWTRLHRARSRMRELLIDEGAEVR